MPVTGCIAAAALPPWVHLMQGIAAAECIAAAALPPWVRLMQVSSNILLQGNLAPAWIG
jgi:hypothetical protein